MPNTTAFEKLHPDELTKIIQDSGIAFLPLGTLEWHEHHLPFGLDAFISHEICKEVCEKTGGVVIPPLFFGTDKEHEIDGEILHGMDAKVGKILLGNIYFLKPDLFYDLLKSITENISKQSFKKLVVVSAHSGTAQHQALEKLSKEKIGNLEILTFPGRGFSGGMDHAGKIETSLMLAIKKDLVHLHKLKKPFTGILGDDPLDSDQTSGQIQLKNIITEITKKVSAQ